MKTQPTLDDTLLLCVTKHYGQRDKVGAPYALHPIRIMLRFADEPARIVALLHDVVEDCDVTLDELREMGYSEEIVAALDCVTKREGESYEEFILRSKANPLARRVKLADLADNMDLSRISEPSARDFERYLKYRRAQMVLENEAG